MRETRTTPATGKQPDLSVSQPQRTRADAEAELEELCRGGRKKEISSSDEEDAAMKTSYSNEITTWTMSNAADLLDFLIITIPAHKNSPALGGTPCHNRRRTDTLRNERGGSKIQASAAHGMQTL